MAQLIRQVGEWANTHDLAGARAKILQHHGHPEATHVMQNMGFTLLGLLQARGDFGKGIVTALNCGYDSDCTAATTGAILGGLLGYEQIPIRWREAAGDRYVVSDWMLGFPRDGSIEALSRACGDIARQASEHHATGIEIGGSDTLLPTPLAVSPQGVVASPVVAQPYPAWRIVGPFWRNWEELRVADVANGEHGSPTLPSARYMSHTMAGMDMEFLDAAELDMDSPLPVVTGEWRRVALDDRLPLDDLAGIAGPACYYACAEFSLPTQRDLWLMLGATGPVNVWFNGESRLTSESYQPLTPNTFPIKVRGREGMNTIVLQLGRTSQPLGACVALKQCEGRHWHQAFFDTTIEWRGLDAVAVSAID